MTLRRPIVRSRLAALIACSLVATTIAGIVPLTAIAEYGIAPGSGAVITAGQPLLVRVTPGWEAEVAYEIADGSYVTVWDVAQTAPDGSMWYPVDGGFVPVDGVTSMATLEGGVALYQEAAPAATEEWVDPNQAQGWIDPATGLWVEPAQAQGWIDPNSGEWVQAEPVATEGWVDPATGEWVEPLATEGWTDPNTSEWVEPAVATDGWIDANTGEWVTAAPADGWIDPNTGEWVTAAPADGWVDPNSGEWVTAAPVEGWIDPNTGEWVQAEPYVELAQEVPGKAAEWVQPEEAVAPASSDGWVDPATGEWVAAAPSDGWVDPDTGEWVAAPAEQPVEAAPADEWVEPAPVESGKVGGVEQWGEPIATAYIAGTDGDGAACRAGAERGTDKLSVLSEGEAIEVRGEAIGEWQPVNCAGVGGYVHTSLIAWEPVATDDGGRRGGRGRSNGGGGSGGGDSIASFAMQYVGYPYAYAGEGPYAFDCSGFTKFVIQNTLGMDITHDMFTQINMGQSVGMNELQPGDLVFFANTFRPGLSHTGVYSGGGSFVHAENESTGVIVSDLNSDYYGSRWAGGTRLA